jgi:hypothetical protein
VRGETGSRGKRANEKAQTTFKERRGAQACGEVARRSDLLMALGRLLCFSGSFGFVAADRGGAERNMPCV